MHLCIKGGIALIYSKLHHHQHELIGNVSTVVKYIFLELKFVIYTHTLLFSKNSQHLAAVDLSGRGMVLCSCHNRSRKIWLPEAVVYIECLWPPHPTKFLDAPAKNIRIKLSSHSHTKGCYCTWIQLLRTGRGHFAQSVFEIFSLLCGQSAIYKTIILLFGEW